MPRPAPFLEPGFRTTSTPALPVFYSVCIHTLSILLLGTDPNGRGPSGYRTGAMLSFGSIAVCITLEYNLRMTEKLAHNPLTDFEALAFFTADYAAVESGKAYVSGGFWDQLYLPAYPAQVSLSVVAVIRVPSRAYLEDHIITVGMIDADDNALPLRIEGNLRVGASPTLQPGDPTTVPMAFPLNGMTIDHAGDYWFVLSIDGYEKARYRIRAVQIGAVPPAPSEPPSDESGEEE